MRSTDEVVIVGGGRVPTGAYMLRSRCAHLRRSRRGAETLNMRNTMATLVRHRGRFHRFDRRGRPFCQGTGLQPQSIDNWDGTIATGRFVPTPGARGWSRSLILDRYGSVSRRFGVTCCARYPRTTIFSMTYPSAVLSRTDRKCSSGGILLPSTGFAQQSSSRVVGGRRIALDGRADRRDTAPRGLAGWV